MAGNLFRAATVRLHGRMPGHAEPSLTQHKELELVSCLAIRSFAGRGVVLPYNDPSNPNTPVGRNSDNIPQQQLGFGSRVFELSWGQAHKAITDRVSVGSSATKTTRSWALAFHFGPVGSAFEGDGRFRSEGVDTRQNQILSPPVQDGTFYPPWMLGYFSFEVSG